MLKSADIAARQSLTGFIQRCHTAELVEWRDGISDGVPLAALLDERGAVAWASRDASAGEPKAGWGRSPTKPIMRGPIDRPLFGRTIDASTLLSPVPDALVVEIADEADGTATGFGLRLRRVLEAHGGDLLRAADNDGLMEIIYSDRYVFSPLSVLLVAELVGAFAKRSNIEIVVRTRANSKSLHATPPWQVQHAWPAQSDRVAVLRKLLARLSDRVQVNLDDAVPHRRTLCLNAEAGSLELTFDQGVGAWQPSDRHRFDFVRSSEEQVRALLRIPLRVTNATSGTFIVIRKLAAQ